MSANTHQSLLARSGFFFQTLELGDNPEAALESLVQTFSVPPMGSTSRQRRFRVIRIEPQEGFDPHSFRGSDTFDLHTDTCWVPEPPRVASLLCVNPDSGGGGDSLFVDGYDVIDALEAEQRADLQRHELVFMSHRDAPRKTTFTAPLLSRVAGTFRIRFRQDLIQGQINDSLQAFIDTARKLVQRRAMHRGELFGCDNHRMLHGRTALSQGLNSDRLFLRIHSDLRE